MKRILFAIPLALTTLFAAAQMPVTTEAFDTIRFEISETGKIIVNATVNEDTVPLRFLFDTGAIDNTLNINSPRAVKTIREESLKEGETTTATSTTATQFTPFENTITLGETEFQGVRFFLAPCAEDIDGIIGWNTLTGADFLIDYDRQRILFYDGGGCEITDTTLWLPMNFIDGLPSIDIALDFAGNTYKTNVWLDSGSDRALDLTAHFISENQLMGKQKPWGISQIAGMEGEAGRIEENIAETLQIGGFRLYQIPLGLNLSTAGAFANQNFGGVAGNNLLQRFNQIWSFAKKRLYLQPNRRMYAAPYKTQDGLLKNRVTLK